MDKLNPAGLISVRATLPIYLIDQVSSLQRRAERRDGKFKKVTKTRNILSFVRQFIESIHSFLLMKICTFQKKSTAGEYTKEGKNICPPTPSKIIYMNYLLILLGSMFLTLKHVVINIYILKQTYKIQTLKTCFEN